MRSRLGLYVIGADTTDDRRAVVDHLAECADCRAECEEMRIVCVCLSLLSDEEIRSIVDESGQTADPHAKM